MPIEKVCIASPNYNEIEQRENQEIDRVLRQAGFLTFLHERDGFVFNRLTGELESRGIHPESAKTLASKLIFYMSIHQLHNVCDATVANLNGRVPAEEAVAIAAMTPVSGKPLVLYSDDSRSLIQGQINPLITGLTDFKIITSIDKITEELRRLEKLAIPKMQETPESVRKKAEYAARLFNDYDPQARDLDRVLSRL